MGVDVSSFVLGAGVATFVCGVIYWAIYWGTVARMRREDAQFRAAQVKRIDDLAECSNRMYDQSRKELGLPSRSVS